MSYNPDAIAARVAAIAAADKPRARVLLGQEAETALQAIARAANAESEGAIDESIAVLSFLRQACEHLQAKL